MTKLTFDVDFNKDPKEIWEIQERAEAEVAKRESKIKSAAFLSKLHEKVNEEIGTDYKSINDLIRALTQFANPKLKEKISSTSSSGRRVTISMTRELFDEIKSKLAEPNPNKAAIARETGASVVQVRKVAIGGYDAKFSNDSKPSTTPSAKPSQAATTVAKPEIVDEPLTPPAPTLDPIPSVPEPITPPSATQEDTQQEDSTAELPSIDSPSVSEEKAEETVLAPPPAPSLDLPPVPSVPEPIAPPTPTVDEPVHEDSAPELPPIAPPSIGEEIAEEPAPLAPPPAPSLDLPSVPSVPELIAPPTPTVDEPVHEDSAPELPPIAPPSIGEEIAEEPAPLAPPSAPSLDLPGSFCSRTHRSTNSNCGRTCARRFCSRTSSHRSSLNR